MPEYDRDANLFPLPPSTQRRRTPPSSGVFVRLNRVVICPRRRQNRPHEAEVGNAAPASCGGRCRVWHLRNQHPPIYVVSTDVSGRSSPLSWRQVVRHSGADRDDRSGSVHDGSVSFTGSWFRDSLTTSDIPTCASSGYWAWGCSDRGRCPRARSPGRGAGGHALTPSISGGQHDLALS